MAVTIKDAEPYIGQPVHATHWTGMGIEARLIGVCDQPSLILETEAGERFTYAVGSLVAIRAGASPSSQAPKEA